MTRTVSVIAFTVGMVLAWGFPVMPAAAAPGFVWGTAELIEAEDEGSAFNPQVAVDPQGNAIAVWRQRHGIRPDIWANRFVPGVGWGTAELIETDDAGRAFFPQVAIDIAGNATAVWMQENGTRLNFSIRANRFVPGVGWGTAELIGTDAGGAFNPQVAVDPQGNAIVVWMQDDGTLLNFSIRANRFVPGVGWGTAELLETDAGDARLPQVAVDPQGNAVAVWMQENGTRSNIRANRFVPGIGWGTAELLENDTGDARFPQVAVDPQGNAVVVWEQRDGTTPFNIRANRFVPGVGWGTAELIETDDAGWALWPQVAVDPQGNAVAVWRQHTGTRFNIWANRFVPGTGWGTAELIETGDAAGVSFPQVAVDPQGHAVAVWMQSADGIRDGIWANRFVPGVGWGMATLIETDAGGAFNPQVAVDPQGHATAVWSQRDSTFSNIWANRFAEDIVPPDLVITSPADGATLDSASVVVSGTASDNGAVEKVELSTDGTNYVLATGTTSWSGTVTLVESTIFARATDTAGNTATVSINVTVDTVKPTAVAGEDQTVNAGAIASFDASPSSDDVAIVSYAWDFGDGTTGTGETTTHVYTDPGTHTVTLTVRDAAGNADTDALIVTVETESVNPIPPEVVTFGVVGAIAAAAAGVALLLWRRRAGGKDKG